MQFITEENRIYTQDKDGRVIAEVLFPEMKDGTYAITKTFVDPSLRGQGVASEITEAAYDEIKKRGRKIRPMCTYAEKWFDENPDRCDILNR